MCFAPQRRALFRHLNFQKWSEPLAFCTFWFRNVLRATTACTFSTSESQKWSEPGMFCIFWFRNVLRATTACTFSTSESQKWSEPGMFCIFWFRNVLRATTACTFSTSQLPNVIRTLQFLTHFTSKCASRHNGVQLFISHLLRCLRTRFSEPTFQPSRAAIPRKNTVLRDFPLFSRTYIFFLLIFSLLTLLPANYFLFHLSILIIGNLTSKFPSIIYSFIFISYYLFNYSITFYLIKYYIFLYIYIIFNFY